jgi:hypothetical protein
VRHIIGAPVVAGVDEVSHPLTLSAGFLLPAFSPAAVPRLPVSAVSVGCPSTDIACALTRPTLGPTGQGASLFAYVSYVSQLAS